MAEAHTKDHEYHMVEPSAWPALGALSAGVTAVGAILFMQDMTVWVMLVGLILVLYTMFVWFRDVVREAQIADDHTPVVHLGLRYGMVLFIISLVVRVGL